MHGEEDRYEILPDLNFSLSQILLNSPSGKYVNKCLRMNEKFHKRSTGKVSVARASHVSDP